MGVVKLQHECWEDTQTGQSIHLRDNVADVADLIDPDDLVDAGEVARIIGLSRSAEVSIYAKRYPDFPRPCYDPGSNKAKLWLRPQIQAWAATRKTRGRRPTEPTTPTPGSNL